MLDAQALQVLRVHLPKISTARGKNSTSVQAMLAAFCISARVMVILVILVYLMNLFIQVIMFFF